MPHIGIIINSHSGNRNSTQFILRELEMLKRRHHVTICILDGTRTLGRVEDFVTAHSFNKLVVAGGDGSANLGAEKAIQQNIPLGVIPTGTFNHFAKHNSIPLGIRKAIKVIDDGHTKLVDVGTVNSRVFLNFLGMGLYTHIIVLRKEYEAKGWTKWAAFLLSCAKKIHEYPIQTIRLTVRGKVYEAKTPLLFIGNNRYDFYGFDFLGKQEAVSRGYLYVGITHCTRRLSGVRLLAKAVGGTLVHDRDMDFMNVSSLICIQESSNTVIIDGEIARMDQPMNIGISPRALRVIVPIS